MIWPFRRKPKPRFQGWVPTPTDERWAIGDIAECVGSGNWRNTDDTIGTGPREGDRLLVRGVDLHEYRDAQMLYLVGWPGDQQFCAAAFRKIVLTDTGADRKVAKRKPSQVPA